MCGATIVYHKCGHYGNVNLEFCGEDPRPMIDYKTLERLSSLGCVKEFTIEYQRWCGLMSANYETPPMVFAPRLCGLCRDDKRKAAREKKPGDPENKKRYDWKSQRETKPTHLELVENEAIRAKEDPYDWAHCSKPWKDPYAESDKEWQRMGDIDENTWREKRNEVTGWE